MTTSASDFDGVPMMSSTEFEALSKPCVCGHAEGFHVVGVCCHVRANGPACRCQTFRADNLDPFDTLPPTRQNFCDATAAYRYYAPRLAHCKTAAELLSRAANLAREVAGHSEGAAALIAKLTEADRAMLGVELYAQAPAELSAAIAPMAITFETAARAYAQRAALLERTVLALRDQSDRECSAHG